MCGIIGYVGKKNPIDILLYGLYSLEYRGYDSAGIAVSDNVNLNIIKSVGRVSELEKKINESSVIDGYFGIAHTRWATHGGVTLENAHPHNVGRVTLVHNGIIENAEELREQLIKNGYTFKGQTDSEVVAALLDNYLDKYDILEAIEILRKNLVGSYALGIIIENEDKIYAIRKDSPLLIGIGEEEYFIASDIAAIAKYTNKYILLEYGETAILSKEKYEIIKDKKIVNKELIISNSKGQDFDKNGYSHYMLKEIMEEPIVLRQLLDRYKDVNNQNELDVSHYKEIDIVACGSAMYAGLIGQSLFEEYASIKVSVYPASEYRYKKKIYNSKTLLILISQSGETADTIAALREAKKLNVDTLGIVNNPDSTIARECNKVILTNAGVEIAVATTKAYLLQVCVLSLMAMISAKNKMLITCDYFEELMSIPNLLEAILNETNKYKDIANILYKNISCFFIGRSIDYAICMEGSLKLKEVSYIHSEAYQAGELKHGTISLIEKDMPVICIISDSNLKDKSLSNLKETEARGALGIVITSEDLDINNLQIKIPNVNKFLQSLLIVPVLQLIAFYTALNKGCDIDKPKNLAKSVTVE